MPGTFRLDGAPGSELRAIRGVVEQVEHWYDPGYPTPGSGGSNVGFVLGHECQYWASRQPTCRDINWMFVDSLDPTLAEACLAHVCASSDANRSSASRARMSLGRRVPILESCRCAVTPREPGSPRGRP